MKVLRTMPVACAGLHCNWKEGPAIQISHLWGEIRTEEGACQVKEELLCRITLRPCPVCTNWSAQDYDYEQTAPPTCRAPKVSQQLHSIFSQHNSLQQAAQTDNPKSTITLPRPRLDVSHTALQVLGAVPTKKAPFDSPGAIQSRALLSPGFALSKPGAAEAEGAMKKQCLRQRCRH